MPKDKYETETESPVDEAYIERVKTGLDNMIPEDFSGIPSEIPVEAKDGEMVSMVVTGKAMGGKLTEAYGAKISLQKPKEGRLKKVFSKEEE